MRTIFSLIFMIFFLLTLIPIYAQDDSGSTLEQSQLGVGRLIICGSIVEREPADARQAFSAGEVACAFTEIVGGKPGDKIYHVWTCIRDSETQEVSKIELPIGHFTWRTWSKLPLPYPGEWVVLIQDHSGREIGRASITVKMADAPGIQTSAPEFSKERHYHSSHSQIKPTIEGVKNDF